LLPQSSPRTAWYLYSGVPSAPTDGTPFFILRTAVHLKPAPKRTRASSTACVAAFDRRLVSANIDFSGSWPCRLGPAAATAGGPRQLPQPGAVPTRVAVSAGPLGYASAPLCASEDVENAPQARNARGAPVDPGVPGPPPPPPPPRAFFWCLRWCVFFFGGLGSASGDLLHD
jgi:hypothetical protein